MKRYIILMILCACLLSGCSRQSTTDFTPYPADQAAVRLELAPTETEVTLESGLQLTLQQVVIGVQTIQPSDAAIGGVAPALRPHSHGEEEEEGTAGEADDGADDPNVEAGDSRPLVPLAVTVNRAVNLLEEALFGSLVVRSGAATGWKMSCVPVDIDGQSLSVMVVATAKFNNQQRAVRVLIADPFEAAFASRAAVSAGMTDQVGLHFHVGEWFANLGLEALVQAGGGEIVIDEEAHEMHEKLLNNVKASTAYEGETHE